YNLRRSGLLPPETTVLGYSRRPLSDDDFRNLARESVDAHSRVKVEPGLWDDFVEGVFYQPGDFADKNAYRDLAERLEQIDAARGTRGNRLFYLATPPSSYTDIVANVGRVRLDKQGAREGWARLVIEKPFGHDLASAVALNDELNKVLDESQVYRIDHYLGKETVRNLLVFRFGNGIFEPLWNRRYVDHVQITVSESVGVGHRGGFYEEAGALRDIVQNHVLQVLALTAMEPPATIDAQGIRDEKVKLLRAVDIMSPEEVASNVVRAQYDEGLVDGEKAIAYRSEEGVAADSDTETFVALRLSVDNWRWAGVPFYVRTGKRLHRRVTEVALQFTRVPHLPFAAALSRGLGPNTLVLRIQPDEGVTLRFGAKVPGQSFEVRSVSMEMDYDEEFGAEPAEAYQRLLLDAMAGDPTLFIRSDEVHQAWRIVEPILTAWETEGAVPLCTYPAGSWGPRDADLLLARGGDRWRDL
ncbi:MAG TPA: glucose-6-phosphate dehydrogenase, partial [Acidimicrobiales bacterium]|nr:glucose-6-phosphate dehydrogenase [Acidimicrobiales bacterium]